MRILHIGNSSISYSRFIDFISDERLTKLYLLTNKKDDLYNRIINSCKENEKFKLNAQKIVEIQYDLGVIYSLIEKLFNYSIKFNLLAKLIRFSLLKFRFIVEWFFYFKKFNVLSKLLKHEEIEVIWSGSNNFDNSNILTWFVSKKCNLTIVRSYKETNGIFMLDELKSLKASKGLIFPNFSTYNHFKLLYKQIDFNSKKIIFADEDYRYSGLISTIRNYDLVNQKYSKKNSEPHIVILTGRATFGEKDSFTNNRYNYLNLIHEFIKNKVHMHLHYGFIFDSQKSKIINHDNNPYFELAAKNRYFHLEKKLNLETSIDDYLVLNKYDAGILHNYDPKDQISIFSNFNIPNRLFEYQIANVKPIIIKDTMKDVENILIESNFGIIGSSYIDVSKQLYENVDKIDLIEERFLYSYKKFTDAFFQVLKSIE
jgi:hypothetical protein